MKYRLVLAALLFTGASESVFAQGTAFTYQGRLTDGAGPAAGYYDLRFGIFNAADAPKPIDDYERDYSRWSIQSVDVPGRD